MSETTLMSYVSPELIQSYQVWTADAVARMRALTAEWRAKHRPGDDARQHIYEIAHNVKGMGSSFGHPLMTDAGRSLSAYLRLKPGAADELRVIEAHIDALERILALGPGSHDGMYEQLVAPLHLLTGLAPMDS
ncbi:MAG TPA: Hpt domain-containing protein [Pedomonas sp.]|uniref:Hpt domain-containing protein n=1 Tax=Pedomonas sp. TaxID=2976421 RepID=UPI002F42C77B